MKKIFLVLILVAILGTIAYMVTTIKSLSENGQKTFEIVQDFSETRDEAIISGAGGYYVIGENGPLYNFKNEFNADSKIFSSRGKYLFINGEDRNGHEINMIKDLETGNVIAQGDTSRKYVDVTKDGYCLYKETTKTLQGEVHTVNVADASGNIVWTEEESYVDDFRVVYDNIILYEGNVHTVGDVLADNKYVFDVTNGKKSQYKTQTVQDIQVQGRNVILVGGDRSNDVLNMDTFEVVSASYDLYKLLNDKYVCAQPLHKDAGIYTFSGEPVKILEGGVSNIHYSDGIYYVLSSTNFYYSLNENFEYVKSPTELEEGMHLEFFDGGAIFYDSMQDIVYLEKYTDFNNNVNYKEDSIVLRGNLATHSVNERFTNYYDAINSNGTCVIFSETGTPILKYTKIFNMKTFQEIKFGN